MIETLKIYAKEVPLVLIALILSAVITILVATLIIALFGGGFGFMLIVVAGVLILKSCVALGAALLLLYLPVAILFRDVRFRILILPCLSCAATMGGFYFWEVRPAPIQIPYLLFLSPIGVQLGLLTGLIHHRLMIGYRRGND